MCHFHCSNLLKYVIEMADLDTANVVEWQGRSQRVRRRPPPSYWEEYVQTDDWYLKTLVEDIPAEEMQAACFDEDFELDEQDEQLDTGTGDDDYEELSDASDDDDGVDDSEDEEDSDEGDGPSSGEEEVLGAAEGK